MIQSEDPQNSARKNIPTGSKHYKTFIGPRESYDLVSAMQFSLLTFLGLREHHSLLDIGCGSLRGGRLFINYLLPGRYFGIEPEKWLVEEGIKNEIGNDLIRIKKPVFRHDDDFILTAFNQNFDFLLAQSIFSHASQPQIKQCLSEAKKVMSKTSVFAATFVRGEQNYTGDKWVYPQCVTYTLEHMMQLAGEQGLSCKLIHWPHPGHQQWLIITHAGHMNDILNEEIIPQYVLEKELRACEERLENLKKHPYVRLGSRMKRFMDLAKRLVRSSGR